VKARFVSLLVIGLGCSSCRDATQATVSVRTNVPFRSGISMAFWSSSSGRFGASVPAQTTSAEAWGSDGKLGSLVVTPTSRTDESLSLKIVLGLGRDPSTCTDTDSARCIVSKRRLAFAPQVPLRVPIVLHLACEGVSCGEDLTCNYLGKCTSAILDPNACASSEGCALEGDATVNGVANKPNETPTPREAGANDAGPDPKKVLCGDTTGVVSQSPWPMEHGCPTNVRRSFFRGPSVGTTKLAPTGTGNQDAQQRGAVVTPKGRVIASEYPGTLQSLDPATGAASWSFPASNFKAYGVLDTQGHVHVTTAFGAFRTFDADTGAVVWSPVLSGSFTSPTMAGPGIVYFGAAGAGGYGVYALDVAARRTKWNLPVPDGQEILRAPAVGNGKVYVVENTTSRLIAIDTETGAKAFDVPVPNVARSAAVLAANAVYVGTSSGIAAFDAQTGSLRWQQPTGESLAGPTVLSDGALLSSNPTGTAFVISAGSGATLKTFSLGGALFVGDTGPLLDVDDAVYCALDNGIGSWTREGVLRWRSDLRGIIVLGDEKVIVLPRGTPQALAVVGP
jgi:outer membrane protein assembly factor BamB